MERLCTNKNHSYKHNEQIHKQNIDSSECLDVKYVKIYPGLIFFLNMVLVDNIGILFTFPSTYLVSKYHQMY